MNESTGAFVASHPMELSALVHALREYASHTNDGGISRELHRRAMAAADVADKLDRERQLAGHRAAND